MTGGNTERRRFGRRACRVHGWIRHNRSGRVSCVMADCSHGGARLMIDAPVRLPPRFTLHFDGLETGIACELRHNDGGTVGVEFATKGGAMPREQGQAIEQLLTWLAR